MVNPNLLAVIRVDYGQSGAASVLGAFTAVLADFLRNVDEGFLLDETLSLDYLVSL